MHPHRRRLLAHRRPQESKRRRDFRSLANGKGLFADAIFTGRLSDAAGLNFWDMDTGEFSLSARSTVGGKTVQEYADGALSDANSYTDAAKQAAITEAKRQADAADTAKLAEAKKYAEAKAGEAETAAKAQSKADGEAAKAAAQAYVDALDESLGQRSIFYSAHEQRQDAGHLPIRRTALPERDLHEDRRAGRRARQGRPAHGQKRPQFPGQRQHREFSLSASSTVGGNKASSLATQTQAQKLADERADRRQSLCLQRWNQHAQQRENDATTKADTALSGAKTYAETIMAYGSNLVRNPNGNPDHDLDKLGASKLTKTMPAAHPGRHHERDPSRQRARHVLRMVIYSFRGLTFRLSGWAYRKAGNVTSSFGIHWMDASGSNHWQTIAKAAATASGWTYVSGSYTVPSNAKTARLWMQVDRDTTTASDADWYWTGLQCTDETAARSYVDTFEGELTQTYIFNKLTNNGQKQGLYLSNGLLYVNATYMRTGTITGKRSDLETRHGIFSMSDANGVETVHLDGNGGHNTLTGTFQTGTSGSRLWMSPKFKQKPIGGSTDITGAGISLIHATDAAQQPYIATESTNSEVGEISTLTFNGGRRANTDPGAFVRVGSTKTDNAKMRGVFQVLSCATTACRQMTRKAPAAPRVSSASPDTNAMDTYSELAAWDPNGAVGVKADINTGYLYLGGFLGGYTNRHTLDGSRAWKAWMPNGGAISACAAATVHFTASSPAKYGRQPRRRKR